MYRFCPLLLLSLFLFTCSAPDTTDDAGTAATQPDPVAERVTASLERLGASPGGKLIATAIEAHGGLQHWYEQSPLYFHFDYRPTDGKGKVRDSYILNDYRNARAVHQVAADRDVTYGFDGKDAWVNPAGSETGVSPRFWSLTPYYFVGLPFVLADEGINFEVLDPADLDGTTYDRVKVTYAAGTGDADQDYYVIYLNPNTGQMDALNYIVSYRGFFEEGEHLPEKLMRLTGKSTVDGILLPTGYATSWSDAPDEIITEITVSDHAFRPDTDEAAFRMPATAETVNDLPETN